MSDDYDVNTDPYCILCTGELEGPTALDTGVCDHCVGEGGDDA